MKQSIQRVEDSIADIKQGKMIIMMDDEDRENEGDLVYAGVFSTPEHVNFMIKEARGVLCTALNKNIAQKLDLNLMVDDNSSQHETAFTVSIDAKNATTGVSAVERDMTIKVLTDYNSKPSDLVRPGHVFPLIAKDGGVLVRTGHTEGSVDLCKMAGIMEVAVICEIVKDDGNMARKSDLEEFAKKHKLSILYVSDIVAYRLANEKLIEKVNEKEIELYSSKAFLIEYKDHLNRVHKVVQFGKTNEVANVKFHNIGLDSELILNSKRFEVLTRSIDYLKANGGILVFLDTQTISHEQAKEFGVGAQILKDLGISKIKLLTTNAETEFVGLAGFGLDVVEKIII
jgi:3,4-dihydroxy 2-butanone 4-phosphate synthase / GTP cyclohydrolase II